ncbi:hypothetical protein ACJIZ3_018958 [Penstemon smallii]|uniref:MI domain-containing protein n=1 Tax=Penstemon smallii TaxID=265156 RepID=A0ABD3T0N7_9LAMI
MDEKKSRRDLRKEARLTKNKKKFDSWVHHQQSSKAKKKPKLDMNSDHTAKLHKDNANVQPKMVDKFPIKVKNLKKKKDVTEQPRAIVNPEINAKDLKRKKGLSKSLDSNFSEFLKLETKGTILSADEDLRFERRLAKKLKVKHGKLGAARDDMDMLLDGIPSALDYLAENHHVPKSAENEGLDDEISEDDDGEDLEDGISDDNDGEDLEDGISDDNDGEDLEDEFSIDEESDSLIGSSEENDDVVEEMSLREESNKGKTRKTKSEHVETSSADVTPAKYVPRALRSRGGNELEEHAQLRKQVKGLLNRLSQDNVESITGEISTLLLSVGCSVGSQLIIEMVVASISEGPRGNEQYAAVFGGFVAGMACLVGIEFGAKLLASVAKCFEEEYSKEDKPSLRNLTLLLSYLYVFGVCSSELVYDFLIMLSKRLTEVDVSTVFTILQCCGMKLRGEDPVGMKNFISSVQSRVSELKASVENGQSKMSGKRMEFMLETICDIKNNKKKSKEDTLLHTKIKKWLQKIGVNNILIRELKWSKLLDPNKKGQWWLSGDMASTTENIEEVAGTIDKEIPETKRMLQLAASQRMNTDARRAIFCVIMSGEDYLDAFEKLLRLELPGKQDREIMRVLVECCLQEKVFNKYYCVLASKLCSYDKNHKFTLQYCMWDHFKELESMPLIRSMHLSKFIAEMVSSFSLSLAVLKAVELHDPLKLTSKRIMHFRMLFETIFEFSDKLIWNIFTRIAITPEYESLRNGIEFFVSKYVVSSQKSLSSKFKIAKKALNNVDGVVL